MVPLQLHSNCGRDLLQARSNREQHCCSAAVPSTSIQGAFLTAVVNNPCSSNGISTVLALSYCNMHETAEQWKGIDLCLQMTTSEACRAQSNQLDSTQLRQQLSRRECCFDSCTAWASKETQQLSRSTNNIRTTDNINCVLEDGVTPQHTHSRPYNNHQGEGAFFPACLPAPSCCSAGSPKPRVPAASSTYVYVNAVKVSGLQVSGKQQIWCCLCAMAAIVCLAAVACIHKLPTQRVG
jgi:hypothetical protein